MSCMFGPALRAAGTFLTWQLSPHVVTWSCSHSCFSREDLGMRNLFFEDLCSQNTLGLLHCSRTRWFHTRRLFDANLPQSYQEKPQKHGGG